MRLLTVQDDGKVTLTKDLTRNLPPYAILSHTWEREDEEVSFKNIIDGVGQDKRGYNKIRFCLKQAESDGLQYIWIDSCCINKNNNSEVAIAIQSMFRWYKHATKCYVYLIDVYCHLDVDDCLWMPQFRASRWFTRGWTLQELLAPLEVEFFSAEGYLLGDKTSLEQQVHEITGISTMALRGYPLSNFSRDVRMSWAKGRETKLEEDLAYSLFGLFEIFLLPIYGEGKKNAFNRLQQAFERQVEFVQNRSSGRQTPRSASLHLSDEESCLQSLWFPEMNIRYLHISVPCRETCKWFLSHTQYQDWFWGRQEDPDQGLLLLKGKPGSGKSTLLKEAYRQAVLGEQDSNYLTAAFFYNTNGTYVEQSRCGLIRSLLYQLLSKDRQDLHALCKVREKYISQMSETASNSSSWLWSDFEGLFESIFTHQRAKRTIIFIDGIDEANDRWEMQDETRFWRGLTKSAYWARAQLSVCLCSRSFPTGYVPSWPTIFVEHYNQDDIAAYVEEKLTLGIAAEKSSWKLLQESIVRKSAGVFLWVVPVVNKLLEEWDDSKCPQDLLKQLDDVPVELEALYLQSFHSLRPDTREITLRLFQWAILAAKPLGLREWHHIMAFIQQSSLKSLRHWRNSNIYTENDEQLVKKIRSLSKGLLEVRTERVLTQDETYKKTSVCARAGSLILDQGETRVVQVIHESVRDFFMKGSGFRALGYTGPDHIGNGHIQIMSTCLDYIKIKELDALVKVRKRFTIQSSLPIDFRETSGDTDWRGADTSPEHGLPPEGSAVIFLSEDAAKEHSVALCDLKEKLDEETFSPSGRQRNGSLHLSLEMLKDASTEGPINIDQWLGMLPTVKSSKEPQVEWTSPVPPSMANLSELLEDHPDLLSYATLEFLTHARQAQK
ncbi:heterokaryon incompatibility protein-domain-containing protein [Astrocystis sublimbata]|nr:heterokaryon incompatibility protein-domain-containing protein [Astrocystis sublimbata]